MWAYAQRDGRPPIGRWRPLLNAVEVIAKISFWYNLGSKKGTPFSTGTRPCTGPWKQYVYGHGRRVHGHVEDRVHGYTRSFTRHIHGPYTGHGRVRAVYAHVYGRDSRVHGPAHDGVHGRIHFRVHDSCTR